MLVVCLQVLIHLNLRQSASPPPVAAEPREQSIQRVQFSVDTVDPSAVDDEPPPPTYEDAVIVVEQETSRAGTLGKFL